MYHIFFIHSSVNGHLGCFHVLTIVNSAAVNIGGACTFLNYGFLWIYTPRSGIAGSYVSSLFSFLRNLHMFSIVAAPIYIPTDDVGGFLSTNLISLIEIGLFIYFFFFFRDYLPIFCFQNWSVVDLQCCVSFWCTAKWFSFLYIYIYIFFFNLYIYTHSSVDGYLGCFHALVIVNSTVMSIGVHVSFQIRVFILSGYMPNSGIAGTYGNYFSFFSFLKNFHTVLHSDCTNLYSYQQYRKGFPFSTAPPTFIICRLLQWGITSHHSDWCEVIPHCSFDLHFSDN